jgi:hypothetical protein
MRASRTGFFHASDETMKKRKTPRMSKDSNSKTMGAHGDDRRNQAERRADERRAHARFEPARAARNDRRNGERRRRS